MVCVALSPVVPQTTRAEVPPSYWKSMNSAILSKSMAPLWKGVTMAVQEPVNTGVFILN